MALRDEKVLRALSEEDRQRLGDNPVGRAIHLTVDEAVQMGSLSLSQLVCCAGPQYQQATWGPVCKWLTIRSPGR